MSIMNAAILAKVTKIEAVVGGGNGGGTSGGSDTAQAAIKELTITEPGVYEANKTLADGKTYNWLTDLKHIDPSTLMKTPDGDDWYIVATFGDEELDYCPSEKVLYLYPETGRYEYDFNTHYGWVFYDKNVNQGIVPPPKLTLSLAHLTTDYTLDELSKFFELGFDGYNPVNVDIPETAIPKPEITAGGSSVDARITFEKDTFVRAGTQANYIYYTDLFGSNYVSNKTYTPQASDITIPMMSYIGRNVKIAGDANLLPENIKKGVVIFGIEGTYEAKNENSGGSGGSGGSESGIYTVTLANYDGITQTYEFTLGTTWLELIESFGNGDDGDGYLFYNREDDIVGFFGQRFYYDENWRSVSATDTIIPNHNYVIL